MQIRSPVMAIMLWALLISLPCQAGQNSLTPDGTGSTNQAFSATGVVQEIPANRLTVVIKHEAISNYMDAMTMPFNVKDARLLAGLHPGDKISFRLNITEDHSWVDQIRKIGTVALATAPPPASRNFVRRPTEAFMDLALTNELGDKVCLNDFRGQALALTFFYTRCPLPEFCPRLSKNFQEATQKLLSLSGAPTNWHFLSISFDPTFDTPAMLKAYGDSYEYQPSHWSFLTGAPDTIRQLADISGVTYASDSGGFKHNFRTLIIDPSGRLQMVFPMGGDISDEIVAQIIKAATVTNQFGSPVQNN